MFLRMKKLLPLLLLVLILGSCSEYQKVLKNQDVKAKYEMAEKFYDEGDFKRANRLLEQIASKYIGKPQGERVMFFFANSYYQIGQYNDAGYQFERFVKAYPRSEKMQEASFLGAKSYSYLSRKYSLDQTDTDKALLKIQNFINTYPDSEYLPEANEIAASLTRKKEKKALEIAKQFTKLGEFYDLEYSISAIKALENFMLDNPGTIYKEEALYYKTLAAYNLAINSHPNKKEERLKNANEAYGKLIKIFPETEFAKKANNMKEKIDKELQNYSK
ncbi:lipoprotein [Cellulophaga lytica]|nr:lipoprotein [Cellulophaga lytica]